MHESSKAVIMTSSLPNYTTSNSHENTELLEHTLGASLDFCGLKKSDECGPCRGSNIIPRDPKPTASISAAETLSAHWANPTDYIPGYSLKELAEAERSLQQLEASLRQDSRSERERQFSLDEERGLSLKPAPPKRSPLTMLTGYIVYACLIFVLMTNPVHLILPTQPIV